MVLDACPMVVHSAPRMLREDVVVTVSLILKQCVDVVFTPTAQAHKLSVAPFHQQYLAWATRTCSEGKLLNFSHAPVHGGCSGRARVLSLTGTDWRILRDETNWHGIHVLPPRLAKVGQ